MSIKATFFDLGDTLVKSNPKRWLPGAKNLLAALKQKGFRLGIISNTGNLADRAAILGLLPAGFDLTVFESGLILFSSEIHFEKPNKKIFEKAVSQAGIPADQCLFCSENIVDTLVAQQVGMYSVRVQPPPGNDLSALFDRINDFQRLVI